MCLVLLVFLHPIMFVQNGCCREWKYFLQVFRHLLRFEPLTLDSYKRLSLLHCDHTFEIQHSSCQRYSDMKTAKSMENANCPDLDSEYKCVEYYDHLRYSYYDTDAKSAPMRLPQPDAGFKDKK